MLPAPVDTTPQGSNKDPGEPAHVLWSRHCRRCRAARRRTVASFAPQSQTSWRRRCMTSGAAPMARATPACRLRRLGSRIARPPPRQRSAVKPVRPGFPGVCTAAFLIEVAPNELHLCCKLGDFASSIARHTHMPARCGQNVLLKHRFAHCQRCRTHPVSRWASAAVTAGASQRRTRQRAEACVLSNAGCCGGHIG